MKEHTTNIETIEQKQAMVAEWINKISETQKVKEIPAGILREVLESYGANFENLSEENQKNISMYSEKKRAKAMKEVWGEKFEDYKSWVDVYVEDYKKNNEGKSLPKMINTPDLINEEREASGKQNMGMISFFSDITAYASGNLKFEDFRLFLETRAENGALGEMSNEEKGDRKKRIIEWDREVDPEKGPSTKDPRLSRINPGEIIPKDKQEIKPASFRPEFPVLAWKKIQTL
jgi:hypothetical protein